MATRRKSTEYRVIHSSRQAERTTPPPEFRTQAPLEDREKHATRPEIPHLKRLAREQPEESPVRKKGSTIPSPGNPKTAMQEEILRLESVRKSLRGRAVVNLMKMADDAEKARELLDLLPTAPSEEVEAVRTHCIGLLRAEMEKTPRPGAKQQ